MSLAPWMGQPLVPFGPRNPFVTNLAPTLDATCIFEDAWLACPSFAPLERRSAWHALLALDSERRIIQTSNHFLTTYGSYHASQHQIYSRLRHTERQLAEAAAIAERRHDDDNDVICVTGTSLLLGNAFTGVNSGHDLSALLDGLAYLRSRPAGEIQRVIILEAAAWFPNNWTLVRPLLGPQVSVTVLPWNRAVRFERLHVPPRNVARIDKHPALIEEIFVCARQRVEPERQRALAGRRLCLIKCARNQQVVRRDTALACEGLLCRLADEHGFEFVNPETWDGAELVVLLRQASHIICSWGGLLYTNAPFFNPDATRLLWHLDNQPTHTDVWRFATRGIARLIRIPARLRNLDVHADEAERVYQEMLPHLPPRNEHWPLHVK